MTEKTVLEVHRNVFYRSLLQQDWDALDALYADEYILVRSNGTMLKKKEVLKELRSGDLVFKSIALNDQCVRIIGAVALLSGESRTISERAGVESVSHFRLVAVYAEQHGETRIIHFQSTDISASSAHVESERAAKS